jgi:hypothetical protein
MPTPFWQAVSELAAMRANTPPERRALSGMVQLRREWERAFLQPHVKSCTCQSPDEVRWETYVECRRCCGIRLL